MSMMDFLVVAVMSLAILFWIGKATRRVLSVVFTLMLGIAVVTLILLSPILLLLGGVSLIKTIFAKARAWHTKALSHGTV